MTKQKGDGKAVQITPTGKLEVSLLDVTSLLVRRPRDASTAEFVRMMDAQSRNYSATRFAANYGARLKQAQDRALRDALPDPELDAFFANEAEEQREALTPEQIERVLGSVPPNLSSIYSPWQTPRTPIAKPVPKQPTDEVEDRMRAVFDGLNDNPKGD